MQKIEYLESSSGRIAYQSSKGTSDVGVVFMSGLASDMVGNKSVCLKSFCEKEEIAFTRFDYFGHGLSDGDFLHGSVSTWKQNAFDILTNVTTGKQILIGSSMSGWIMFSLAKMFPEKIAGLIGIGAAPDFTEDFRKQISQAEKKELEQHGYFIFSRSGDRRLLVSKTLLDDGLNNLILNKEIKVSCPVVLMHGLADDIVSYEKSIELAKNIKAPQVEVRLLKDADHSMSDSISLDILKDTIMALIYHPCNSHLSHCHTSESSCT